MSIKRLTVDERATYLIGLAVRRHLLESPRDRENLADVSTVLNWIQHWLSEDQLDEVRTATGFILDDDIEDEFRRADEEVRRLGGTSLDDDDMPF